MSKMGKFKASDLQKFQKQLSQLQESTETFIESCTKDLAARLLRKVKKRTPVGHYSEKSGKKGGTLRRGWTVSEIRQQGKLYTVDVANIVEYASYVEFGHRTPNHHGWVPGHFMLTFSEEELEQIAPKVLESKIRKILKEYMK